MVLQKADATDIEVFTAGTQLLITLYGGKVGDRLADLRYDAYCKMSLSRRFQPERLPPSETDAHMRARRVHLQAVIWGTLNKTDIKTTDWGWESKGNSLKPLKIVGDVAPQAILKFVRCNYHSNCSSSLCSCRKNGQHCVSACGHCHGTDCTNAGVSGAADTVESDTDSEPDTTYTDTVVDRTNINQSQLLFDDDIEFFYEEEIQHASSMFGYELGISMT